MTRASSQDALRAQRGEAYPRGLAARTRREAGTGRRRRLLSVDVFDTTLTRSCGPPTAAFLWLGRRLFRSGVIEQTPEAFARARIWAERIVWHRAGSMDAHVFLDDFYREVVRSLWLDPDLLPTLVEEELRLEEEVLRPVPRLLKLLEDAQRAEQPVVFLSDTYFPLEFVVRQLKGAGVATDASRCLVSSDRAQSKASGGLFDVLLAETGVAPVDVLHLGDNPHSDKTVPRRKGLQTRPCPDGRLNRHERLLADHMWETSGMAAAMAGASRFARMHTPAATPHEQGIRDVAAGVAAPMLVSYVLWVLQRAETLSIQRLYFLSRDGQVLADIAKQLIARLGLGVDVSYLYVSRLSTNLAATFTADEEELGWVFRDKQFLSPEAILSRFDIPWSAASEEMRRLGVEPGGSSTPPAIAEAMERALRSAPLRRLLLERAAARRSLVRQYLDQEGVLDDGKIGIVDFGGVGSQVRALHVLIEDAGRPAPHIFLVGVDRPRDAGLPDPPEHPKWLHDTECYLYDHRRGLGIERFRGFGTCMQMFCAADHDTVTGYRLVNDRVEPTLGGGTASLARQWGLATLRTTVHSFVDHLTIDEEVVDPKADLRETVCAVIKEFWLRPTREEARSWGSFPFEGAQAANSMPRPLATRYSWSSTLTGLARRTFPDLGWQHWFEGSIRLSPPVLRTTVRGAENAYWRLRRSSHPVARRTSDIIRRALDRGR